MIAIVVITAIAAVIAVDISVMPVKPLDWVILIPAVGIALVSFFVVYSRPEAGYVINLQGESGEWVFPMDADETVSVAGPLGVTVVAVSGGAARILASPCLNRTCIAAGAIHAHGQWAACLPNRVMVYISAAANGNDTGVDAAAW